MRAFTAEGQMGTLGVTGRSTIIVVGFRDYLHLSEFTELCSEDWCILFYLNYTSIKLTEGREGEMERKGGRERERMMLSNKREVLRASL